VEVFGDAESAFDRYAAFRSNSSFGAKKNRAKLEGQVLRQDGASIGSIRAKLFEVLLEHIPDHPGFRIAPLPQQSIALRLRRSHVGGVKAGKVVEGISDLKTFLVGPMSEAEQLKFPGLDDNALADINLGDVTLASLFDIGGFSHNADVNSVYFNDGSYLSAFSKEQKKASVTRLVKSKEGPVALDKMYASPKKRKEKQQKASLKVTRRGASTRGGATRIPVAGKRGCITEKRFFDNMEKLHEKQEEAVEREKHKSGKRGRRKAPSSPKAPNVFFSASVEDDPMPPPDTGQQRVQFVVKLQSNKHFWQHAELLLEWLKSHPLVVLDPGKRW
jgi:hypothetical protein